MGKFSRSKGSRGELEICRLLSDELGVKVQRNIGQTRSGGADCIDIPGFALEVKRTERLARPTWWAQAVTQGEQIRAEPLVLYRRSREPWQALIRTVDGGYREATFEQAVLHIREKWSSWP